MRAGAAVADILIPPNNKNIVTTRKIGSKLSIQSISLSIYLYNYFNMWSRDMDMFVRRLVFCNAPLLLVFMYNVSCNPFISFHIFPKVIDSITSKRSKANDDILGESDYQGLPSLL